MVRYSSILAASSLNKQKLTGLEEYRSGRSRMPLQSQRQLADLIVSEVPALAREARRLQLQCEAEEAFQANETTTHMLAPPNRFR
jgi:hypothetical protein